MMINNFERSWGMFLERLPNDNQEAVIKLMTYYTDLVARKKSNLESQNEPMPQSSQYSDEALRMTLAHAAVMIDDVLAQVAGEITKRLQQQRRWF